MAEQDTIPTARMHWTRLVLGRGHPVIIIVVLSLVGAGICWFSLHKISSLTQTPTRYSMEMLVATEGCGDREFRLGGNIGSFGPSYFQLVFMDGDGNPLLLGGCRLKSIRLSSNLPLQPDDTTDSGQLIRVVGGDLDGYVGEGNMDAKYRGLSDTNLDIAQATIVDGDLRALDQRDPTEIAPSFSMHIEEGYSYGVWLRNGPWVPDSQPDVHYEITLQENWQPIYVIYSFVVPGNIKTYFGISAFEEKSTVAAQDVAGNNEEPAFTYDPLDISMSLRTDDMSVVRGSISDSGDAKGIGGDIQFGIENNDAESRRESGNVRYSAILGIGIALLVEAFVILLAIGMRALATRLGAAAMT